MEGTLSYTYHHHTLGTVGDSDNSESTGGAYDDSYLSPTAQGCFTEPDYAITYTTYYPYTYVVSGEVRGWATWHCSECGKEERAYDGWGHTHTKETGRTLRGYKCGCGHTEGSIVSVTITY